MLHQTRRREISELFITEGYRTAQADDFLILQKRSMKRLQLTIFTSLSILFAVARPLATVTNTAPACANPGYVADTL